jgi:hypothetical protein
MSQGVRIKRTRVGDDVMTYCGRCKAERIHIVAAMKSETEPAEVICRTCNTKHRFRRSAEEAAAQKSARAAGGAPRRPRLPREEPEAPPVSARAYAPGESYAEGEWLAHTRYGVGRVKAVRGGKIDVRFDKEVRTLVHAG